MDFSEPLSMSNPLCTKVLFIKMNGLFEPLSMSIPLCIKVLFIKMNELFEPLSMSIPLCIKVDDDDQYCSTAGSAGKMSKKISSHCVD